MLVALNEIAAHQAHPTQFILTKCDQLLDYASTYPNVKLRFKASDMILYVDSDTAYLIQDRARSRIAGHYILNSHPPLVPFLKNLPSHLFLLNAKHCTTLWC